MIPKIIHYCWFGRNPLPKDAQRCIASWKKFFPDYEIKEWSEDNFDVNMIPYIKEAYGLKKYAYVSDYARLWILNKCGGLYFDTDVEIIRPIDDILGKGGFMGFEKHEKNPDMADMVNLGLGFASMPNNKILQDVMDYYESNHYLKGDGKIEVITIVHITTKVLKQYGLRASDTPITIEGGFTIYPWEYFCPMEYPGNKLTLTENTRTIHHYTESWMTWKQKTKIRLAFMKHELLKKLDLYKAN